MMKNHAQHNKNSLAKTMGEVGQGSKVKIKVKQKYG